MRDMRIVSTRRHISPDVNRSPAGPPLVEGAGCDACRSTLSACREQVRHAGLLLEKVRRRFEVETLRVDRCIDDLADCMREPNASQSGQRASRHEPVLSSARAVSRSDGFWDVHLEDMGPFTLSPMLGRLFQLLAEHGGHDIGDGLVGFKTNGYLLTKLHEYDRLVGIDVAARRRRRSTRLNQAILELRDRLGHFMTRGRRLVQTRRTVGFRIALRKGDGRSSCNPRASGPAITTRHKNLDAREEDR